MSSYIPRGLKADGSPYKILIVDDSGTMRKIIGGMLKEEMYEICGEASDGGEGFEKYKELKPDLVTLDVNMPNVSGIESLKKILEFDSSAKAVMLTSEGQKESVSDAIDLGAKDYIVKPPEKDIVLDKVNGVLKS
jgi:two-component system chemotaxis response regulator CheY